MEIKNNQQETKLGHKIYFPFLYCFLLLCVPTNAKASEFSLQLYETYTYNSPKNTFTEKSGTKNLAGKFAGDLLMPDTHFAGHSWKVRLEFIKEKLSCVSLMGPYSKDRIQAVMSQVRSQQFELLGIVVDKEQIDLIALLKAGKTENVLSEINALTKNKKFSRLSYLFFDTAKISKEIKMAARNLYDFFMLIPSETKEVELTVLGDKKRQPRMMLIDFRYPILNAK